MRIVKLFRKGYLPIDENYCGLNRIAKTVSSCFDTVVKNLPPVLKYDCIKLVLDSENGFSKEEKRITVMLNYNDVFVRNRYEKGVRALILQHIMLSHFEDVPGFFRELFSNRQIIKSGFSEDLMFYCFVKLLRARKPRSRNEFLDISLPWLSFYGTDDFYSSILKDMADALSPDTPDDLSALIEKIKNNEIEEAVKSYGALQ